jgi:uncharacterized membrane-anchored protein YjiN (DUF445 family)
MEATASASRGPALTVQSAEAAGDPRPAALRRMRLIATLLLGVMALIFVLTTIVKLDWPWIPYLRAFAEAGMVGACADWFAIVALFRRPLGLPIPHTAIVARNKDRIGKALGRFITNNFLTSTAMSEKLARVDIVGSFARWAGEPANAKRAGEHAAVLLPRIARSLPAPQIGESAGKLAQQALAAVPAAPLAAKLLAIIWAEGEAQALLERTIDYSEGWLAGNRDYLTSRISRRSSRWIPKWIDRKIAEKVLSGLQGTLGEMRDPSHPWRVELGKSVEKLIVELASDPKMHERAEGIKADLLASPLVVEQAKALWAEVEAGLNSGFSDHSDSIKQACEQALLSVASWLEEDEARKARLNRRIRVITQRFLHHFRFEIGGYIERVVHDWDSATLVERLELQIGKDLQYIRINGTLVGGLVGLLIFAASKWLAPL